jgi:hypothetical protein
VGFAVAVKKIVVVRENIARRNSFVETPSPDDFRVNVESVGGAIYSNSSIGRLVSSAGHTVQPLHISRCHSSSGFKCWFGQLRPAREITKRADDCCVLLVFISIPFSHKFSLPDNPVHDSGWHPYCVAPQAQVSATRFASWASSGTRTSRPFSVQVSQCPSQLAFA